MDDDTIDLTEAARLGDEGWQDYRDWLAQTHPWDDPRPVHVED